MHKVLYSIIFLFFPISLFSQIGNCDSSFVFSFINKGNKVPVMNGYTITVKTSAGETLEFIPKPISYLENDSLIIDYDFGYIETASLNCDSLTIMTYKFKDFKVSFKCEALCKWGFMDLGIYIYHFSNIRQLRRHIKAKRAIVHPMNTSQLRNVDFPLTLIGMNTEEFVVEIEVVD